MLLRLAGEGEGGAIVRRRIALSQLEVERRADVAEVVAQLTDRRLLTVDDGAVEVAHEALLREWPRLRGWLEEDAQGRRLHRQISEAAEAWDADDRDPGGLYRGARLSGALEWRAAHEEQMNATERAFLDAGRAAAGRAQRRLRLGLGAVSALLLAAVIAGLVALDQRGNARDQARTAEAQRLGAQALSERALDRSLLLARQAVALDDSFATRSTLLSALLRSPAAVRVLRGGGGRMLSVAVSPDGRTVVTGDNNGNVHGVRRRRMAAAGARTAPASPFARSGSAPTARGSRSRAGTRATARSTSSTRGRLRAVAHRGLGPGPHPFHAIAFSPDSRVLASGYSRWNESWTARNGDGSRAGTRAPAVRCGPIAAGDRCAEDFLVAFAGGHTADDRASPSGRPPCATLARCAPSVTCQPEV